MTTAETKQATIFNGFVFFFGKSSEETCQACCLVALAWLGGLKFNQCFSQLETRLMETAGDVDPATAFNAFAFIIDQDKGMTLDGIESRRVCARLMERMGNTLRLELGNLDTLEEIITYWKASQYKYNFALFGDHPVAIYVINCLVCDCVNAFLDIDGKRKAKRLYLNVCFLLQCLDKHTPLSTILKKWEDTDSSQEFLGWFPILSKALEKDKMFHMLNNLLFMNTVTAAALEMKETMLTDKHLETLSGPKISIQFVTSGADEVSVEFTVYHSMRLKWLLRAYSKDVIVPLKSIRFSLEGNPVFLSSVGKKTLKDVGLKDGSIIQVSVSRNSDEPTKRDTPIKSKRNFSKSPKNKKNKKRRNNTQKKAAAPNSNLYSVVSEEEMHKRQHSKSLSKVFEEAERTKFRAIRQQLNAMNLERTKPKSRKARTKPSPLIDNPPTSGVAGKAGKAYTLVQVGEESSLYKTSKPFANHNRLHNSSSVSSARKVVTIDLHGLTKSNALAKLDETLPRLVSEAMRGEYPFVALVKIIHGGGSQILAEAVAGWIKQNKKMDHLRIYNFLLLVVDCWYCRRQTQLRVVQMHLHMCYRYHHRRHLHHVHPTMMFVLVVRPNLNYSLSPYEMLY